MKHKLIDLKAEVKRAVLPEGMNGFLFPLYEAISNSLHSIEDCYGDDLVENGKIHVTFDSDGKRITVSDNGNGLNKDNLKAFLTPLTGNKYERGGKGFGRFMSFKIFTSVFYSSGEKISNDDYSYQSYKYDPFSENDNLIELDSAEGAGRHPYKTGVTVLMHSPFPNFEKYFGCDVDLESTSIEPEDIVAAVLDHFLIDFIQAKIPENFHLNIQNVDFNLHAFFQGSLRSCEAKVETISIGAAQSEFSFNYFKVSEEQAKKHRLYFYANNRAASSLENISSGLNDKAFIEQIGSKETKYFYLVAVSSEYFVSSQSRDRITNLNAKIEDKGRKKSIKDYLIVLAKSHILEFEKTYTQERRTKMASQVDHLIAVDPLLRRGLGSCTSSEFVERRSITETREQLAQDLFVERFRKKFDFTKLDENASIDQLYKLVQTTIPEDAKEALAVYVAYRNNVIQIFRKLLEKQEDGVATEDQVHNLIYPRYKDSEQVDYSSHNLWLLDDDLAYASYISSDRTPEGNSRGKGEYAHDLLINNQKELMIVEMKRPQKKGYSTRQDGSTNNPVNQLKNQIADIRKKKKVISSTNREIDISSDSMVRGYILADWNDSFENYLAQEDFSITNYGGKMAYKYYSNLNLMIEVLAFDRLIDRASNRNEAFVQMLDGRSTYDRKTKGALTGKIS